MRGAGEENPGPFARSERPAKGGRPPERGPSDARACARTHARDHSPLLPSCVDATMRGPIRRSAAGSPRRGAPGRHWTRALAPACFSCPVTSAKLWLRESSSPTANRRRMGTTAVVFPGQGSQRQGMARDFHERFASSREVFAEASDALGFDVAALCFDDDSRLDLTEFTQPAILTAEIAMMRPL